MENKYTIENLVELFSNHAIEAEKQRVISRERYEKEFNTPLAYDDSFSLPMALMTICKEISVIKNKDTNVPK